MPKPPAPPKLISIKPSHPKEIKGLIVNLMDSKKQELKILQKLEKRLSEAFKEVNQPRVKVEPKKNMVQKSPGTTKITKNEKKNVKSKNKSSSAKPSLTLIKNTKNTRDLKNKDLD